MSYFQNLSISNVLIGLLRGYRYFVSPWLGNRCRFYPSCSQYAIDALKTQGLFKGFWLIIKRLSCCHPFHPGGYNPAPGSVLSKKEVSHEL